MSCCGCFPSLEDLKRGVLVKPKPGEKKEELEIELIEDLTEHDRLNASFTSSCTFSGNRKWADVPSADRQGPGRVSLMFLTVGRLNNDDWWESWFQQADEQGLRDRYSVVYHRGGAYGADRDEITDDALARRGVAAVPITKTGWARSGLVRASLLLMRHALELPDCRWLILVSDSCMPVYTFKDLLASVSGETQSRLNNFGCTFDMALCRNPWQPGVCTTMKRSRKADQWAMWVRDDATWFVEQNHLRLMKPLSVFVDEPFFINMMDQHGRPYLSKPTTHTVWWHHSDAPICGSEKGWEAMFSSPHIFRDVDLATIRAARGAGCWFVRKVAPKAKYPTLVELALPD